MDSPLLRRLLVWSVAVAAMAETFLQSIDSLLDDRLDKALLWFSGAIVLMTLALVAEKYKQLGVE